LNSRTTRFACSTAFLALLWIFGGANQALAGYMTAALAWDNPSELDRGGSAAGPVEQQDFPNPTRDGTPKAGHDLFSSLFGLTLGRTNSSSGGAGSTSNSNDSGGSGQPLSQSAFLFGATSENTGKAVIRSDFLPSLPIASRLFRPPRFS
jgi:hypothetical protein